MEKQPYLSKYIYIYRILYGRKLIQFIEIENCILECNGIQCFTISNSTKLQNRDNVLSRSNLSVQRISQSNVNTHYIRKKCLIDNSHCEEAILKPNCNCNSNSQTLIIPIAIQKHCSKLKQFKKKTANQTNSTETVKNRIQFGCILINFLLNHIVWFDLRFLF